MCKMGLKERNHKSFDNEKSKSLDAGNIEEALTATGFGRYNFGLLLICSWTLQAMGMDLFGTSFVVAAAVCDLQLTMQQRALLTAMPLVGVVAGAQLWGYISDTKGRRLTLVLSMSVGFVFAALSSFAPDWKTMAVLKLISSTFTSASNSGAYTLLGESCPERARGRSMLLCTCSLMCSQAVVAVFAYPILPLKFVYWIDFLSITYRPWRLLALVMSLPCAATACLLQLFHESPKFLVSRGKTEQALEVLKKIYAVNTGNSPSNFPITKLLVDDDHTVSREDSFVKAMWEQTVALFRPFFLMCALSMGILSVYFVELYPTHLRGMASCLSVMLGRSSAFLGVNAIGALISANCEATFYGWSLLLLTAIAFSWYLPRDKKPAE
ncbi:PREDICTED: synaptic vesicle glycoprotein 2C-like [Papilio polytes]|uniref:synaptic vesicle glycoprotein 2C-like n=1 Tax=Papilio polytes TaxID=76194 RepID=UPI0006761CCE|nr:PREDICTED: synaptic vesicle glycoprotein 2C-like [Papilio polytes]